MHIVCIFGLLNELLEVWLVSWREMPLIGISKYMIHTQLSSFLDSCFARTLRP
jgi:hypothetical protein